MGLSQQHKTQLDNSFKVIYVYGGWFICFFIHRSSPPGLNSKWYSTASIFASALSPGWRVAGANGSS